MGVEIECIIPNRFSKSEIIELPVKINSEWKNIKQYIVNESKKFIEPITIDKLDKTAKWNFELNENEMESCWSYYENDIKVSNQPKNDIWFFCYFGMIKFYRKTIVINPLNLRYKAFKNENLAKTALLNIVREIIKLFDSDKVLYCADSSTKTEILSNLAMEGKTYEDIIQHAISNFGKPNQSYFIGIDESYFIDEIKTQKCPRCNKKVNYNPRYPKYICKECRKLNIMDEDGFKLTFSNIDMSGGLLVKFWKNEKLIKEDSKQTRIKCYIEGIEYEAKEARFGGIVIEKKDYA